ncbi:MAG: hypothetical protein K1X47_11755 [Cyclobacteriaceae bacterium]|nr:hypothetical protein [Cyclobacteriaceae bacterium]
MLRFALLFLPYLISLAFTEDPVKAYAIAWLGSFWIFWLTITGKVRPLSPDLTRAQQFMRPPILTQLVFAGYMAVTSIFYFLDVNGYNLFDPGLSLSPNPYRVKLAAECQQLYCLAHACLATSLVYFEGRRKVPEYQFKRFDPLFLLYLSFGFTALSIVINFLPGLQQLEFRFGRLSLIASIVVLFISLRERTPIYIMVGGFLFVLNMLTAFLSGWKEAVLVPIIILSVLVYPLYKRIVLMISIPLFVGLLYILPTYNDIVRTKSWYEGIDAAEAAEIALDELEPIPSDIEETNWEFLTLRLSEIHTFTKFKEYVPEHRPYYGTQLAYQGLQSILPRILYPGKPNMEEVVMERVYEAGVIKRGGVVSAKPPAVIDAYLSGGALGIILTFLTIGALASLASREAERLFGGYLQGTALVYTGLFQIFWRGNCFEFMFNAVLWSFVLMYALFWLGRRTNLIVKVE